MPHVTVRRSSTQRSALASLVALTVFAALALIGTPASSLPTADDDIDFSISSDIVIKDDVFLMREQQLHKGLQLN